MKTRSQKLQQKFLWVCGLLAACSLIIPSAIVPAAGAQSAPRIGAEVHGRKESNAEQSASGAER
jgi:hypothetical protein